MSFPEPRLKPDDEMQFGHAAGVVRPAGPESKQAVNVKTPSQAESLLAAEKRTLEMMANGANLSEVLNDLCAAIDAHAPPVTSMVCLMNGEWLSPCAGPHVPATFKAAITPWRIGPDRASCGAAAFTKQKVIVPNISKDPRWPDDARDLTLSHGFSAAWSELQTRKEKKMASNNLRAMLKAEPFSEQAGMPGELIYEHAVQIKQVTEYGVAFDRLLSGAAAPPAEGARFDLRVEGTVTGPKLKG